MSATNELNAFIICEGLVKIFQVANIEVLALQGLDITVQQGELIGVVGASGSGKTTLMNVLGGLIRPSAGKVVVNGQNLLKMSTRELDDYRQRQVGFVWQQGSRNLVPYLSALENVKLPATMAGVVGREVQQRAEDLLELVGLADRRDHKPAHLSGGEQQRVAIAVAMVNQPQLLLADEPTGELDSVTAKHVYETFQRLNRELGLTILIVSHDPDVAHHVGRVVAIRDGKTATETVRRRRKPDDQVAPDTPDEDHFEELIVLDSAGRLQIPKEFREQVGLYNRAQMELTERGILIRPVTNLEDTSSQAEIRIAPPVAAEESNFKWLRKLWRNRS
ncbi:MAG: ABC transporter ATP-binding protein [Anaerolineae bacterium]|nr:ABC transporter ATP-binding protein [Anaerolineae bacterium]